VFDESDDPLRMAISVLALYKRNLKPLPLRETGTGVGHTQSF
jgi:hypothetical protein